MYIYLSIAILTLIIMFFKSFLPGGRRGKDPKPSSRDRRNGGGGGLSPRSSQRDLCEVSGHDRFFRPSLLRPLTRLLVPPVGDICLAKSGLWETREARRE